MTGKPLATIAFAIALHAGPAFGFPLEPPEPRPPHVHLLKPLIAWIDAETRFTGMLKPTEVRVWYTTSEGLCAISGLCVDGRRHRAITVGPTIHLRDDFDPTDRDWQATLIHELVHLAQWRAHSRPGVAWKEAEADRIQARWERMTP